MSRNGGRQQQARSASRRQQPRAGRSSREAGGRSGRAQGGRAAGGNSRLARFLTSSNNMRRTANGSHQHSYEPSIGNGDPTSIADRGERRSTSVARRISTVIWPDFPTTDAGGGGGGGASSGPNGRSDGKAEEGGASDFIIERRPTFYSTALYRACFWLTMSFPSQVLPPRLDDVFCDSLSYKWIARVLIFIASFVVLRQFVGSPIACWAPNHFTLGWEEYTNNYCWVSNTYYLPFSHEIPQDRSERKEREIRYYQWVPLVLAVQAFSLAIPAFFWRFCNGLTGWSIHDMVESSIRNSMHDTDGKRRHEGLDIIAKSMDLTLSRGVKRRQRRGSSLSSDYNHNKTLSPLRRTWLAFTWRCCCCCCCLSGIDCGCFLTVVYVVYKILSILMPIANLFALDTIFGFRYWRYGFDVLWTACSHLIGYRGSANDVILEDEERRHPSGDLRFPRVTLCDLDVRSVGNVNRYTIQCVLTANLFFERIYLILWFVFVALALNSLVGLVVFLSKILARNRQKYVSRIMCALPSIGFDPESKVHNYVLQRFVSDYLKRDGFLLLHFIGSNANRTVVADVLMKLWQLYAKKPEVKMMRDQCKAFEETVRLKESFDPHDGVMPAVAEGEELV